MLKLKHYSDAGHGWLAVKRSVLVSLKLIDLVTNYSYVSKSGGTVYLEEDQDASTLIKVLKQLNIVYSIESVDHGDRSYIRNLKRFEVSQNETVSL